MGIWIHCVMENGGFIVTSYFTLGTAYADVCHKFLMPTVRGLQLHSDIRAVPNKGTWLKNTAYKPEFLRAMMETHKENLVFVDVDAQINFYPGLFLEIPEEYYVAAHFLDKNAWYGRDYGSNRFELLSGTLWFRNCAQSKLLLEAWDSACKSTNTWEQKVLQQVMTDLGITCFELPLSYCYIGSLPGDREPLVKVENPVIVHNQVSRKLKRTIG